MTLSEITNPCFLSGSGTSSAASCQPQTASSTPPPHQPVVGLAQTQTNNSNNTGALSLQQQQQLCWMVDDWAERTEPGSASPSNSPRHRASPSMAAHWRESRARARARVRARRALTLEVCVGGWGQRDSSGVCQAARTCLNLQPSSLYLNIVKPVKK